MSFTQEEIKKTKKFNLEDRLIKFSVLIIGICSKLENSKAGIHLSNQLLRSGTSPALNYGEAQSSESRRDFIHKVKIVLKELRETKINLNIIEEADLIPDKSITTQAIKESSELIAIFVKSAETATANLKAQK